ncbi:MAG: carboxypeptidase regulatory-like domain-containing protein [Planctomycetota bacterium]
MDGTWGPKSVPVLEGDEYLFWLDGVGLVKEVKAIEPPLAGASVELQFVAEPGFEVPVLVLGAEEQELKGARVEAKWIRNEAWRSHVIYTDDNGIGRLCNLPAEVVHIRVSHEGYIDESADPIEVSASRSVPTIVRLTRAGTITGRCLHGTDPVSSFELLWWKDFGNPKSRQLVRNSSDGTFTISRAPLGDVTVMATSSVFPQSEAEIVRVVSDSPTDIVLQLTDSLQGRGRVLDAATSSPIARAMVQVLTHYRGKPIEAHGASFTTDSQGHFEIAGLVPGGNPINVSAPGYATRTTYAAGVRGETVEFGLVPLCAKRAVEITLQSKGDEDLSTFVCELSGTTSIPDRRFSTDGVIRYDALDPGPYGARIVYPGQKTYRDIAFVLSPGQDTFLRVLVETQTLLVRVIPDSSKEIPDNVVLCVQSGVSTTEFSRQYYGIPSTGEVEISRVAGLLVATVETWDGEVMGITQVEVRPKSSSPIEVRIGAEDLEFQVVDVEGETVSGVTVFISYPSNGAGWYDTRVSDTRGRCTFTGLSLEEALVLIHKYPEGYMAGKVINVRNLEPRPIELLFAPDWDLRVLLVERSVVAGGIDVATYDSDGIRQLPDTTSDAQGLASIARVSGAGWTVRVAHPSYWPTEYCIGPHDPSPFPVQVRRLGSVEFSLKTPYGNPAPGVTIDMQSAEIGEMSSSWIRAGRARVSNLDLRTGSDGKLRFDALPNGPYRWWGTMPTGEIIEGEIVIPPQATAFVNSTTP